MNPVIISGIFVLSLVSGMLGLGVAFAAVPFLGLFLPDLVHQIQPLRLLLNGTTALLSMAGFARSGLMDWKRGTKLAIVCTVFAPVGVLVAQRVQQLFIWIIYFAAVLYLAYRLFRPVPVRRGRENFRLVVWLAAPIAILSGFLGVGPGFLLMPSLVLAGFDPKLAAGMNALAVAPPSFSALLPHLHSAQFDSRLLWPLLLVGAVGSYAGARITSRFVPSPRMRQLFAVLILLTTLYKVWTIVR